MDIGINRNISPSTLDVRPRGKSTSITFLRTQPRGHLLSSKCRNTHEIKYNNDVQSPPPANAGKRGTPIAGDFRRAASPPAGPATGGNTIAPADRLRRGQPLPRRGCALHVCSTKTARHRDRATISPNDRTFFETRQAIAARPPRNFPTKIISPPHCLTSVRRCRAGYACRQQTRTGFESAASGWRKRGGPATRVCVRSG